MPNVSGRRAVLTNPMLGFCSLENANVLNGFWTFAKTILQSTTSYRFPAVFVCCFERFVLFVNYTYDVRAGRTAIFLVTGVWRKQTIRYSKEVRRVKALGSAKSFVPTTCNWCDRKRRCNGNVCVSPLPGGPPREIPPCTRCVICFEKNNRFSRRTTANRFKVRVLFLTSSNGA